MRRQVGTAWRFVLSLLVMLALSGPVSAAGPKPKDFVSFNGRIAPTESENFDIPTGRILVITDIFIQNRAPGDGPVDPAVFTAVALSGDPDDFFLTVVGNDSLNLQLTTGIRVSSQSPRILDLVNSTAPFIEYVINGFLTKRPKGF